MRGDWFLKQVVWSKRNHFSCGKHLSLLTETYGRWKVETLPFVCLTLLFLESLYVQRLTPLPSFTDIRISILRIEWLLEDLQEFIEPSATGKEQWDIQPHGLRTFKFSVSLVSDYSDSIMQGCACASREPLIIKLIDSC